MREPAGQRLFDPVQLDVGATAWARTPRGRAEFTAVTQAVGSASSWRCNRSISCSASVRRCRVLSTTAGGALSTKDALPSLPSTCAELLAGGVELLADAGPLGGDVDRAGQVERHVHAPGVEGRPAGRQRVRRRQPQVGERADLLGDRSLSAGIGDQHGRHLLAGTQALTLPESAQLGDQRPAPARSRRRPRGHAARSPPARRR